VLPALLTPPTIRTAPFFKRAEVCPVRGVCSEPVNCEACEAGAYSSHEVNNGEFRRGGSGKTIDSSGNQERRIRQQCNRGQEVGNIMANNF